MLALAGASWLRPLAGAKDARQRIRERSSDRPSTLARSRRSATTSRRRGRRERKAARGRKRKAARGRWVGATEQLELAPAGVQHGHPEVVLATKIVVPANDNSQRDAGQDHTHGEYDQRGYDT